MRKSGRKAERKSAMTKFQKIIIAIALGFLLYSILGFLVLPVVLKNTLEKKLSENLNRAVSIENIQINPYSLKVTVNKFMIRNRAGDDYFIAFDRLFIDLEAVSLFKRALIIKSLVLSGPRTNIAHYKDLTFNFSDIATGSEKKKQESSTPFLFSINNIEILDGDITFLDEPKETTHRIHDLNLTVPFLSNVVHHVETYVHPDFSAIVNGTPFKLSGRTIPFHDSLSTVFDIKLSRLSLPAYLAYLPDTGNLTLKSGFLDVTATLGFAMPPGNKPSVTINGDFAVRQLTVASKDDETYLTIPQVDITLADSKPLEMSYHFSGISLTEPEFLLRRTREGNILPLALLQKNQESSQTDQKSSEKGPGLKLVVDEIGLTGGTLRFEDQKNAEPFQTTLKPVDIKISGLSTQENAEASYDLALQSEAGESIAMNGSLSLNPLKFDTQAKLQDLQIPRFKPYYNEFVTFQVKGGSLDLEGKLDYAKSDDTQNLLAENIGVTLDSLAINDRDDKKLLVIPSLSIRDSAWRPDEGKIIVGDLASSGGQLHLVRQQDGLVNLKSLVKAGENQQKASEPAGEKVPAPLMLTLKKGTAEGYSILLQDQTTPEPTNLLVDNLNLTAENISTAANSRGSVDLALRIDKKGTLSVKGPVVLEPLSTALKVSLADLQVKTVQPYFADAVNLVIGGGSISADGILEVTGADSKDLKTIFQGKAGIADFDSFDPVAGEDFLKWKALNLDGIEFDSTAHLHISEINWQDFYNNIVVFDNGSLNLKAILNKTEQAEAETPADQEPAAKTGKDKPPTSENNTPMQVEIESVKLTGGNITFLDRSISPHYSSSFSDLSGTIDGLSSQADVMASVNISAKLDQHAPLRITGKVNPLREDFYADLVFDFRDIELSPTSPYSGKYIGYKIAKGKLSLDLDYLVEGSKITGRNQAFLDQFTLGDTVESPDAMNLPINLAIALLKNRKGEITLNVPVQGDLDDPEFSIGGVVFKAIVNLIAKAATSPFALLGAFLPEGEDLQHVDFDPGSADLAGEYTKNLEAIAKALYDRPGLKMDIKAGIDPDRDKPALHEKKFEQLLKNEKYKELSREKQEVPPLEQITVAPDEFETFLEKAYKAADFEKPENFLGLTKKLPPEEMEKLLREHIVITDDDLRLLAIERANAVKSILVESGPVDPDRIFIVEPEIESGEKGSTQAEMIIK